MKDFRFNKIYVIESLSEDNGDDLTGLKLHENLLQWVPAYQSGLSEEYVSINDSSEWNALMDRIKEESANGVIPILHFEAHGTAPTDEHPEYVRGISLQNAEIINAEDLCNTLREINRNTGCNLFVSLAVCSGLQWMIEMGVDKAMPFVGILGAWESIKEYGIYDKFSAFYENLFSSFDILTAFKAFGEARPEIDARKYACIMADDIFCNACYKTFSYKKFGDDALREKAKAYVSSHCPNITREAERQFKINDFVKKKKANMRRKFKNLMEGYFILQDFTENKERFEVPSTLDELKERYEKSVFAKFVSLKEQNKYKQITKY